MVMSLLKIKNKGSPPSRKKEPSNEKVKDECIECGNTRVLNADGYCRICKKKISEQEKLQDTPDPRVNQLFADLQTQRENNLALKDMVIAMSQQIEDLTLNESVLSEDEILEHILSKDYADSMKQRSKDYLTQKADRNNRNNIQALRWVKNFLDLLVLRCEVRKKDV